MITSVMTITKLRFNTHRRPQNATQSSNYILCIGGKGYLNIIHDDDDDYENEATTQRQFRQNV